MKAFALYEGRLIGLTKKEKYVLAIISFLVGMTAGLLIAPGQNGKVVINGDNNHVRTGHKSYDGNHNGCGNKAVSGKTGKK